MSICFRSIAFLVVLSDTFSLHTVTNGAWNLVTGAVLRLVWPSILLQSARDRLATAAKTVTA